MQGFYTINLTYHTLFHLVFQGTVDFTKSYRSVRPRTIQDGALVPIQPMRTQRQPKVQ